MKPQGMVVPTKAMERRQRKREREREALKAAGGASMVTVRPPMKQKLETAAPRDRNIRNTRLYTPTQLMAELRQIDPTIASTTPQELILMLNQKMQHLLDLQHQTMMMNYDDLARLLTEQQISQTIKNIKVEVKTEMV